MQPEFQKIHFFKNSLINKKSLKDLMYQAFLNYGIVKSSIIADHVKNVTFHYATKSGISISVEDLRVPSKKRDLIGLTSNEVELTKKRYNIGVITGVEQFQKTIDIWNNANNFLKDDVLTYFRESDPLNPLYIMAFSGARGNISQVRQLVGMRGLMSNPQGQIIDLPIRSNFREGLNVTEYIISSYGARKGLVDTALRTADSGYLTRRLVDVAQDVIVREEDCGTVEGLYTYELASNNPLNLRGRLLAESLFEKNGNLFGKVNTEITEEFLKNLDKVEYTGFLKVRSALTCRSTKSVCRNCYGWHLSHSKLVDLGEAVGIVAAQSIGEPGTQLTMRTFHTGGVFSGDLTRQIRSPISGRIEYEETGRANLFRTMHGKTGFRLKTQILVLIKNSSETTISFQIPVGSLLLINNKQKVYTNEIIAEIQKDANLILQEEQKEIFSTENGEVFFEDLDIRTKTDKQGNIYKTNANSGLIWILQSSFYELPSFSDVRTILGRTLPLTSFLSWAPIFNRYPGQITTSKQNFDLALTARSFSVTLKNATVKSVLDDRYLLQMSSEKSNFTFDMTYSQNTALKDGDNIATLVDNMYCTETGGTVAYSLEKPSAAKKKKSVKNLFNGYFYWIPEETYALNYFAEINSFPFKNGELISPETEIFPNIFSKSGGLVQIDEGENKISIKPGELFKINSSELKLTDISNRFVKPGEFIITNKITAQRLVYLEFLDVVGELYILVRPVSVYKVPRDKYVDIEQSFFPENAQSYLSLKMVSRVFYKNWEKVISNKSVNLLQTFLVLEIKKDGRELEPKLELVRTKNSQNFKLRISLHEIIKVDSYKKKIETGDLIISVRPFVQNKQYVKITTLLAQVEVAASRHDIWTSFRPCLNNEKIHGVLILNSLDLKKVLFDSNFEHPLVSSGDLIRIGTQMTKTVKSPYSGQVFAVEKTYILIRLGQPYLISPGTILQVKSGDLIKNGDVLGTLVYDTIKTTDIVQGLPKVEELLEARKVENTCILAPSSGYAYLRITKNRTTIIQIIELNRKSTTILLERGTKVKFTNGEFVRVGTPLTDGLINPHVKLDILFSYYKQKYTSFEACKLSFKALQLFLIGEIQKTYLSQGVDIADKHVEIIVKQMTSKVYIEDSGTTTFLPGEVLNFQKVAAITNSAESKGEIAPSYIPLLLGITKASLNSDSFISAASFQETTRVLTEAAIEGRKDWLNGLKENVIIGRLIPAGTGFDYAENQEMIEREKSEINFNFKKEAKSPIKNILDLRTFSRVTD
jgi:DNA-directed RNA polymerase subunit beta'